MKTEFEFTLRFVFDPTRPVKSEERAMLEQCIGLVRQMKGVNPRAVSDSQLLAIEKLHKQASESIYTGAAKERREKKWQLAVQAIEGANGNKRAAARALGITRNCLVYWLRQGKEAKDGTPARPP